VFVAAASKADFSRKLEDVSTAYSKIQNSILKILSRSEFEYCTTIAAAVPAIIYLSLITIRYRGVGRGCGAGRGLAVGAGLGVGVGGGVGIIVADGVAVGVGGGVAVPVGVGVGVNVGVTVGVGVGVGVWPPTIR
jgi:hypothetical protein